MLIQLFRYSVVLIVVALLMQLSVAPAIADSQLSATAKIEELVRQDKTMPKFGLIIGDKNGPLFESYKGEGVGPDTTFRYWSATKLISAVVAADLVEKGQMSFDDPVEKHYAAWEGAKGIKLYQFLSMTSGLRPVFTGPALSVCHDADDYTFDECLSEMGRFNRKLKQPAGRAFDYGGSHWQVAGKMAVNAARKETWADLFRDFREEQGVFPKARYVFQSDVHPRIGGGIVGSTSELAEFAQKFFSGEIVSRKIVSKMMLDKTPKFTVKMKYNPVSQQIREQWHYGTGLWIECAERRWKKSCEQELIYSSMGHGGTYIWYDAKAEIWAVLVRDDTGLAIFPAPPSVRFLRKIRPFMEGLR